MLTASLDLERSRLRRSTGIVTEHESKALASGGSNNPGERGASQIVPREESRSGGGVTGVNTLRMRNGGGSIS